MQLDREVMGEHVVLSVNLLTAPESVQSLRSSEVTGSAAGGSRLQVADPPGSAIDIKEDEGKDAAGDENAPLIQTGECRICQEEDSIKNLENPCACSGSLKFAHRACVQRWCDEKGDVTCEICNQPYQPGYTAPTPTHAEETAIDISGGWTIAGAPLDLNDPRFLAMANAERRLLEAEYDEYDDSNTSGAAFFRSAALILMALLLLRHAFSVGQGDGDEDDLSTFFSLFLLRAAGFLLPCYIMAWAISILQRRRQRQEAAAIAAAEVAFMLQAGQHRGIQVRIAPVTPPATVPPVPANTAPPAYPQSDSTQ